MAGLPADAMAAQQWRCSPRPSADAHKYTITYGLCSIRMVRTKNCTRRKTIGRAPPSIAHHQQGGGQQAAAAGVQVCHAGSQPLP